MRQFDVCPLRAPAKGMVVVLQNDVIGDLATRVVAPLSAAAGVPPIGRLQIGVAVGDQSYLVQVDRLSTIHRAALGPSIAHLRDHETELKRSLDFLFFGI